MGKADQALLAPRFLELVALQGWVAANTWWASWLAPQRIDAANRRIEHLVEKIDATPHW